MRIIAIGSSMLLQATTGGSGVSYSGAFITQTATVDTYPAGAYTLSNSGTLDFIIVVSSVP